MHSPEWICLIIGAVIGYQTGIRHAFMRLGRAETRARMRTIRGRK